MKFDKYILLDWLEDMLDSRIDVFQQLALVIVYFLTSLSEKPIAAKNEYKFRWQNLIISIRNTVIIYARDLSPRLQEKVSKVTGYQLCEYCLHVVYPGENHTYCETQLFDNDKEWFKKVKRIESDIMLDSSAQVFPFEYQPWNYPEDEEDTEYDWRGYNDEDDPDFDPYGYSDDELGMDDDQPTQVWFTEPPGGHNGWE